MFDQPGFLGTNASLASDLSLMAYLLLLIPLMLIGYRFARRRRFNNHKWVMTGVVALNWVLIVLVMSVSYRQGVAPYVPDQLSDSRVFLPVIHLVTGGVAQVLATYLVLRMWLESVLPSALKVKNIRRYMRATLALWLVTVAFGVVIYIAFYVPASVAGENGDLAPVATQEANPLQPVGTEESVPAVPAPSATEEAGG